MYEHGWHKMNKMKQGNLEMSHARIRTGCVFEPRRFTHETRRFINVMWQRITISSDQMDTLDYMQPVHGH